MLPRRAWVVLTTPNRWFPVEFHRVLPVSHWLPKKAFRALTLASGHNFFVEESNLNLLSVNEVRAIGAQVSGFVFNVWAVSLWE